MSISQTINQLKNDKPGFNFFPIKNSIQPYLILFLVSISIYINSIKNEVAFDDESVLHKNEFVMMGIKGIPGILTHDTYYSYYKQLGFENNLPAGRYRPLAQVTNAIEQEFIGTESDGIVRENSWDTNKNKIQDTFEDTNGDALFTEYDFWSKGSGLRHLVNVLLFALMVIVIYHVCVNYFFDSAKDMVFFSVLLFAVHPIHTEVVANIKSRDEILSLLFVFLTLFFAFKTLLNYSLRNLTYLCLCMFLALLSKEYAVFLFLLIPSLFLVFYSEQIKIFERSFLIMLSLIFVSALALILFFNQGTLIAVPVLFFISGYYFFANSGQLPTKILFSMSCALILYLALRFSATTHAVTISTFEQDILANPYKFANDSERIASKVAVWMRYVKLFFLPNPLLVDYSYKTLPYSNFQSPLFLLSVLFYSVAIVAAVYSFIKKTKWFFALSIFLVFFLPVSNLFIDIGATMGERLFFHASLGFSFMIGLLIFRMSIFSNRNNFLLLLLCAPLFVFSILTIKRNPKWKNNMTLFLNDVQYAPNNINILAGAGTACYDLSVLPENKNRRLELGNQANYYYNKSLSVYPDQYPVYMNKSVNFLTMGELDSSFICTEKVLKLAPNFPNVLRLREKLSMKFMLNGISKFEKGKKKEGFEDLLKSIKTDKKNDKAWNNLGKALLTQGAIDKAYSCFKTAVEINPKNKLAEKGMLTIDSLKRVKVK